MKIKGICALIGLMLILGGALDSAAQVKQIRMRIGGYLCGN